MSAPTVYDAERRAVVRLPDGRTGRLIRVPGRGRSKGSKARVVIAGAHLSIPVDDLEVLHGEAAEVVA